MPYLETTPGRFGYTAEGTSREAAEAQQVKGPTLRRKVYDAIGRFGPEGATPDDVANLLGLDILTVRPRFTELLNQACIEATGRRRKTGRGGEANVMIRTTKEPDQ